MSPIRKTEALRCHRRVQPRVWAATAPVFRAGRIQLGVPRQLVQAFAEGDYCYGIGTLTMVVDRIDWARPVPYEGDTWLEVEGMVVDRTGQPGPRRTVLIRAALLPVCPPRRRPRRT